MHQMAKLCIIITSRVSSGGNRISPICLSVRLSALSRPNRLTYGHKIWCQDVAEQYLECVQRARS